MRTYVVQPGDSPAGIASRPHMAGCPKCAIDLVHANPHKRARKMPNGFVTFESLVPGERINLPGKWFDGSLDDRPKMYFSALAYPDGVTPSTLGDVSTGILGDYAALDAANAKVAELSAMSPQPFIVAVGDTAAAVDTAVKEVTSGPALQYAESARNNTVRARARNADLNEALVTGADTNAIRNEILVDFSTALVAARAALKSFYEPMAPPSTSTFPPALAAAAQAAASAIAADENYCAAVAHTGTTINAAVHAFKTAWNSTQNPSIPINTGNYEQATAEAIAAVLGGAPLPCEAHSSPAPPPPIVATASPVVIERTGLSTGAVIGIGLLGAGAVGGAVYLATQKPIRGRRQTGRRKRR